MMRELFDVGPSAWADVFLATGAVCVAGEVIVSALAIRRPETRCDVRRGALAVLPAVAVAALLLPIWTWSIGSPVGPSNRSVEPSPEQVGQTFLSGPTDLAAPIAWGLWTAVAWAAVAAVLLARLVRQAKHLAELRRGATPVTDPAILSRFARLARRLGFTEPPLLLTSAAVRGPTAAGGSNPAVIVPPTLFGSPAADAVLAHELAHLARRDPAASAVAAVIAALLWFQPLVRWVARRCRADAEFVADEAAVRIVGDAVVLADHLARLAESRCAGRSNTSAEPPPALNSPLARRIERLLELDTEPKAGRASRAGIWAVTAALLAAACVPRLGDRPAWARPPSIEPAEPQPTPAPEPMMVRVVRLVTLPAADARKAMETRFAGNPEFRFAHDDELGVVVVVGPVGRVPAMHELLIEHDRLGKLP